MDAGRTSSHFNDSHSEPGIITASYVVKKKRELITKSSQRNRKVSQVNGGLFEIKLFIQPSLF